MVDSTPHSHGPPSITNSTNSPSPLEQCAALVGLMYFERFALGAASGNGQRLSSSRATGWDGIRTATVGRPAVTQSGICSPLGKTNVRGPGHHCVNCSSSFCRRADSGSATASPSRSRLATCTISGLLTGLPLAAKIFPTAVGLQALAARPYTVSVGITTKRSSANIAAARASVSSVGGSVSMSVALACR